MSDAKDYITKREIPQLFECLMTGLMYHRPSDHVNYLQDCLSKIKSRGLSSVRWDLFLEAKKSKTPLPPVTPPRNSRPSSRASSKAESLFDKRPILPPISNETASRGPAISIPALTKSISIPVLLLIGGPGSGKQRVARAIAERYNYALISAGGQLKATAEAAAAVAAGELAPDALALAAVIRELNSGGVAGHHRGILIEGYPRSLSQLEDYMEHIQRVDHALLLDYEEAALHERLLHSRGSGGVAEIARRLNAFKAACLPACRALDDDGKLLVLPVDPEASDASVTEEAARLLDSVLGAPSTRQPQHQPQQQHQPQPLTIRQLSGVDIKASAPRSANSPTLILLMGGPGSGRSTCLERLERLGAVRRLDAADCGDNAAALAARLEAVGGADGPPVVIEGFPETEAGLRSMYGEIGAPDLALLIDCQEADMLKRLRNSGAAAAKMATFKQETLPVVQHLDQAGRLCVVLGDKQPDDVLKEVKALIDFVVNGKSDGAVGSVNRQAAEAARAALGARLAGVSAAAPSEEEAAAAAKIQAGFRGYQTRKQLAERN